jgi:hypothetical protein
MPHTFAKTPWAAAITLIGVGLFGSVACAARLALVVGNDNYHAISSLKNAGADADAMATALKQSGYDVTPTKKDRTQRQLRADVREFRSKIRPGDEVVFFYSGHGVALGAANYLLPVDVGDQSEAQVMDEAVALGDVLNQLAEAKPALTLAIIDACRDNPFPPRGGKSIATRGLTNAAAATGQMVIYAAGTGQKALDRLSANDPVKNGVFTRAFVAEMKTPNVPIDRVLKQVRTRVAAAARAIGHEQVPAIYDQVEGDFYFYRHASIAPELVSPSPTPVTGPTRPSRVPLAIGEKRISITFKGTSWTEVRSKGEVLFSESAIPGTREFTGAVPLTFIVGNASRVSVFIDGKAFDMANVTRNDVARFRVE